jgi:hypothetical protein
MRSNCIKLDVAFFRSESGAEPVRVWLRSLTNGAQIGGPRCVESAILLACRQAVGGKFGTWIMGGSQALLGDRIARVIFFVDSHVIVLLHGFIKKTQKTPKHELDLAIKRMRQFIQEKK